MGTPSFNKCAKDPVDDLLYKLDACWETLEDVAGAAVSQLGRNEDRFRHLLEDAVLRNRRIAELEKELEDTKVIEERENREFNTLKLEELEATEGVKKKHITIPSNKLKDALGALKEWERVYEKWKTKLNKVAADNEMVTKFVEELGIKAISDEETGQFTGLGLNRIDPLFAEYEGIIYFADFNILDWSFNEVVSLDPKFPKWREFVAESNRRKDLTYTLLTVRRHWAEYFTNIMRNLAHVDVEPETHSCSSNNSGNISGNSGSNPSFVLFEDSV